MSPRVAVTDDLKGLLERTARSVRKQFPRLELEELIQEGWLWVFDNPRVVKEHEEADNLRYLFSSIRRHLVKYARQYLADTAGYEVDDMFHYSVPQIRTILPKIWELDWAVGGQAYDKQPSAQGTHDPADAWVAVADVRAAYGCLAQKDKDLLYRALGGPGDPKTKVAALAREAGVTDTVLAQRIHDALARIQRKLGGAKPRD